MLKQMDQIMKRVLRVWITAPIWWGLAMTACRVQPKTWDAQAAVLIAEGKGEEATRVLESYVGERMPRWYQLMVDAKADCAARLGGERLKAETLGVIDEGIAKFPKSSRLRLVKGFLYGRFGDFDATRRYYEEARETARANIAADEGGATSNDDRKVLQHVEAFLVGKTREFQSHDALLNSAPADAEALRRFRATPPATPGME